MKRKSIPTKLTTSWLGVLLSSAGALAGCQSGGGDKPEDLGQSQAAVFTNGDFETGAPNNPPPSWTVQSFLNPNGGVTIQTPQTKAGLNLQNGGNALTNIIQGVDQPDPDLGAGASLRWPRFGSQCARVNFHSSNNFGNGRNVNSLAQSMTVGAGDVDPADNKIHIRFTLAPVLQNPGHAVEQQPYYFVQLTNVTQGTTLYSDFNLSAQPGVPWKTVNGGTPNEIDYVDWSLVDISPGNTALAMGDTVKLEVIGGGCSLGGHFGEVYVDGVGTSLPGLFVSATGPAQANAGDDITYDLMYKNGAATAQSGVVIDFTTPPGTTFQGLTPPTGATCTTPAVGATGTIVCTFANPLAANASGTFNVTVQIDPTATGQVVCGTYDILSAQESPLIGNKVTTLIGCGTDTDCSPGHWCHESAANACLPTLPNGTPIPNDPPHTNPLLDGTCTALGAALVCQSQVCEPLDNECGLTNGHGPCVVATPTVCRSGVCDTDLKCGYADGDGPCTVATGPALCRSTQCSVNGFCEPQGGCNVDADCTGGDWCNETAHACTPKLPNASPIPTDGPHTNPTLNGMCTTDAGTLVCVSQVCEPTDDECGYQNGHGPCDSGNATIVCRSAVCDPDLHCGYADGDGPCTMADATVVCRSGACGADGKCEPQGGCNTDADCTGGNWCNEAAHACTPKLPNGTSVPNDPTHTGPTLDGHCTTDASTLVCQSLVCDKKDDKCGYQNGDGPCTGADGSTVCRSALCATTGSNMGLCVECITNQDCKTAGTICDTSTNACTQGCAKDSDCTSDQWCNEGAHMCTPKLPNGTPVPTDTAHMNPSVNGTCTPDVGTLVCESGVCDTADNACGLADGDGPCATGGQCRGGTCNSINSLCGSPTTGCGSDADCPAADFCSTDGACTPKLMDGVACQSSHQCQSADCSSAVCSSIVASGSGIICATGLGDTGDGSLAMTSLAIVFAGLVRRSQTRRQKEHAA